jgi:hypothetical protein
MMLRKLRVRSREGVVLLLPVMNGTNKTMTTARGVRLGGVHKVLLPLGDRPDPGALA